MVHVERREYLLTAGVTGVLWIAGCTEDETSDKSISSTDLDNPLGPDQDAQLSIVTGTGFTRHAVLQVPADLEDETTVEL